MAYDPAFGYEVAVIIQNGMKRMYQDGENIFYYLTLYNEEIPMPPMPEGVESGILNGLYKFKTGPEGKKHKAQIFGSGPIIYNALKAQEILAEKYNVSADVWSATSYNDCATMPSTRVAGTCFTPPNRRESRMCKPFWKKKERLRGGFRFHEDCSRTDRSLGSWRLNRSRH